MMAKLEQLFQKKSSPPCTPTAALGATHDNASACETEVK